MQLFPSSHARLCAVETTAAAPVAALPVAAAPVAAAPTAAAPAAVLPAGTLCVAEVDIVVQQEVPLNMEPGAVGFGEIAPGDLQGNFAPMRISNTGTTPLNVNFISCTPIEGMEAVTSTFFLMKFGNAAGSPRVQCVLSAFYRSCFLARNTPVTSWMMFLVNMDTNLLSLSTHSSEEARSQKVSRLFCWHFYCAYPSPLNRFLASSYLPSRSEAPNMSW